YVLDNSDAKAVVHDHDFGEVVREAISRLPPARAPTMLETGEPYDAALRAASPHGDWEARTPDGDDLVFLYTGGTTGMPKGVMWRSDDLYVARWQMSRPGTEPPDPIAAAAAGKRAGHALPACPLLHGHRRLITLFCLAAAG